MPSTAAIVMTPTTPLTARRRSAPSRSERRLAGALRAGEPRALEALHAEYGATVFGYLLQTLRDRAAAEDVFQQVLTEAWKRGAQYDPARASLATWLLTIARSRAIDELRRRRPEPVDPDELPDDPVEDTHEQTLERWRITHLLGQLPVEERHLLELRFYAELSQTEIAERTGLALGTVKSRMVRALERLRGLMESEEVMA